MPSRYYFTDYSHLWPQDFEAESANLFSLLGAELLRVHHIGSTSVPRLAAKPIIDLLPIVRNIHAVDDCTSKLEAAGYKAWGEYGLPGRRLFTKDRIDVRTHNAHIYQDGDPAIERHLAFCDYLRGHPQIRDEYAELKRQAYAQHPADIAAYSQAKDGWIKRVEQLAIEWFREVKRRDCQTSN
jgi:GrpB-like predicted nucleotidyltransferase (UPF0157 family)